MQRVLWLAYSPGSYRTRSKRRGGWCWPTGWRRTTTRAELLRLHRRLTATCCEPDAHPERARWQARAVELLVAGARPCVPQHTLELPGGVPLTASFIPPGSFLMGGTVEEDEGPVRRVALTRGFFLGVHPVTQAQWRAITGAEPSHFKGSNRPVEMVSWDECREFCAALAAQLGGRAAVRLPTEAEWEYACRAGTTTEYHFGDVIGTGLANYNGKFTWNGSVKGANRKQTTEVGSFPPNGWGLYDVHGNVMEWCADGYAAYPETDRADPNTVSNPFARVIRGGAWGTYPRVSRAAFRNWRSPASRFKYVGFRLCFQLSRREEGAASA